MAIRQSTLEQVYHQGWLASWSGIGSADEGKPVSLPDKVLGITVQLAGTLGVAGALKIQASDDGVTYYDLPTPIAYTALGIKSVAEIDCHYRYYKPVATGGDGTTSFTVYLFARTGE